MPGLLRLGLPVRRFHQLSRIVTSKVSRNYVLFLAAVTPPSLHCTVFRKRLSVLESVIYGQVTFVTSAINSRSGTPPGAISSSRIDPTVASHDSALKAHRQNVKRREHNRQLRTRLRGALRDIRAAIDSSDPKNVNDALRADDFAGRQDGGEGTHPPEHGRPLQVPARGPRRQAIRAPRRISSPALTPATTARATTPRPVAPAARAALRPSSSGRGPYETATRRRAARAGRPQHRQLLAHEPRQLPQNHERHGAGIKRQPELTERLGVYRRAESRSSRPNRPARSPR